MMFYASPGKKFRRRRRIVFAVHARVNRLRRTCRSRRCCRWCRRRSSSRSDLHCDTEARENASLRFYIHPKTLSVINQSDIHQRRDLHCDTEARENASLRFFTPQNFECHKSGIFYTFLGAQQRGVKLYTNDTIYIKNIRCRSWRMWALNHGWQEANELAAALARSRQEQ